MRFERLLYTAGMERHVAPGAELLIDESLYPILLATWRGQATVELVNTFNRRSREQIAAAKERGELLIMISDASAAERPNADVRRAFAEHRNDPDTVIRTYAVITNALIRGALTAVGWLTGGLDVVTCATLDEALADALEVSLSRGLPLPSQAALASRAAHTVQVG